MPNDRLSFDRDGADWPHRETSAFVEAGGLRWHVQRAGAGPVALLLHGTGASTHSWAGLVSELTAHFSIVAPDLPGHAFTSMPAAGEGMSLPGMARSVAELLGTIGVTPALVIGHSAGAAIGIRMCVDRLIAPAGLVSINGALLPFQGLAGHIFSPLAKMLVLNPVAPRLFAWRAGDERAVARVLRGTGGDPDQRNLALYSRLFRNTGHVAGALAMMARWDLDALARDLGKLDAQVLLIAGSNDGAVPVDDAFKVAKRLRHARVEVIRGAGHLVHEERSRDVAGLIERFFAEVGKRQQQS